MEQHKRRLSILQGWYGSRQWFRYGKGPQNHLWRHHRDRTGTRQAFVGEVTKVNVWGVELSESDIVAQYHNFHITLGSVNEWRDFKDGVRGGTDVIEPSC